MREVRQRQPSHSRDGRVRGLHCVRRSEKGVPGLRGGEGRLRGLQEEGRYGVELLQVRRQRVGALSWVDLDLVCSTILVG